MRRFRGRVVAAVLALLLGLLAVRLVHTARVKSFVVDEEHYVGTGLYLWESGDYDYARALRMQPPLAYHLASLGLPLLETSGLPRDPTLGRRLIRRSGIPLPTLRLATRLPFLLVACWGAVLCFLFARALAGDAAGLLSAFLFSFSPNVLANGFVAHSDLLVSVLYLQTLFAYWLWTRRPTPLRLLGCGLSLGLALAAKATGMMLAATLGLLLLAEVWAPSRRPPSPGADSPRAHVPLGPEGRARRLAWAAGVGTVWLLCAAAVLFTAYGFSFRLVSAPAGPLPEWPLPAYLQGFLVHWQINAAGRAVYFWGEVVDKVSGLYFPMAFALKVPLTLLALLALAFGLRATGPTVMGRLLVIPLVLFVGIALFVVRIPLGLRYVLPVFPLLFVFVGTQIGPRIGARAGADRGSRPLGVAMLALCAGLAFTSLSAHPHYLSYFNALAGGARGGARFFLDSNLDWGQDLSALARFLRRNGNPPVHIAYLGPESPRAHGIRAIPLRGCAPVQGWVAISANVRAGLYSAHDPRARPPPGCYDWLETHEPVARPGGSISVYRLEPSGASG